MLNSKLFSRSFVAILLTASLIGCASSSDTSSTTSNSQEYIDTPAPDMSNAGSFEPSADTRVLTVYGMSCPLCATNVDKQLLKVPGVQKVDVNLADGRIQVKVDEQNSPSDAQLKDAVIESGFTFKSIE